MDSPRTKLSPQQAPLHCALSSETSLSSISMRLASCWSMAEAGHEHVALGMLMRWVKVTWLSESIDCSSYSSTDLSLPVISLPFESRSTEHRDSSGTLMLYTWLKIMGWLWLLLLPLPSVAWRLILAVHTILSSWAGTALTLKNSNARLIREHNAIMDPHIMALGLKGIKKKENANLVCHWKRFQKRTVASVRWWFPRVMGLFSKQG